MGVKEQVASLKEAWRQYGSDRVFQLHLGVTVIGFLAFLRWGIALISSFEARHGRVLADPILQALPPRDFSVPIFALIYSAIIITVFRLFWQPARLLFGLQAGLLILVMRTISLYLVPLEPPPGMILLEDPFIAWVFGSEQNVAVKDLFFSGHVAIMSVLIFVTESGYWRKYLVTATVLVATFIAWQHVHYSVDIFAAPVFVMVCGKFLGYMHRQPEYGLLSRYAFELDEMR